MLFVVLVSLAMAADPIAPAEQVVQAEPMAVYRVVADLSQWTRLWGLDDGDGNARSNVRGAPLTTEQVLQWSAGERARGTMRLLEVEPGASVAYAVEWPTTPGLATNISPVGHAGRITLAPVGGGTTVTWTVERDFTSGDRMLGLQRRLEKNVEDALEALAEVAEEAPPAPPTAPEVEMRNAALLWGGFHHRWTYNHRINRSGDWWTVPECAEGVCTATQVHAAASGTGADRATFDGLGTLVAGPGVKGWYGDLFLWFDGKEAETLSDEACFALPDTVPEGPVLLRGYDLDAVESADSLWEFAVSVGRDGQQVCAEGRIKMACRTPECGSEALTTYSLKVPFVVVTGPDLATTSQYVVQHHRWEARDLRDEPMPEDHPVHVDLPGKAGRPVAVGLSGFSVALDAELHTRGLDVAVRPGAPTSDGAVPVDLDLFYVQWGPVEIAPLTVAQFAHAGEATMTADVVLVQPRKGCVAEATTSGVTFWGGKQADASVPDAEHRAEATFDVPCAP